MMATNGENCSYIVNPNNIDPSKLYPWSLQVSKLLAVTGQHSGFK